MRVEEIIILATAVASVRPFGVISTAALHWLLVDYNIAVVMMSPGIFSQLTLLLEFWQAEPCRFDLAYLVYFFKV